MSKNIDIDGGTKTCETERFELSKRTVAVCVTRQSHEAFFRDGLSKRTVDFEKQWKVMSQARLCCRVCGRLVSERSPSTQLLMMNNIRRRPASGRMSGGAESLVRQDNVVRHAKASE